VRVVDTVSCIDSHIDFYPQRQRLDYPGYGIRQFVMHRSPTMSSLDAQEVVFGPVVALTPLPTASTDLQPDALDTMYCANGLDEVRDLQRQVFELIVHFQRNVAVGGSGRDLIHIVGSLVDCVKANFASEERWLLHKAPRRYRAQCRAHRKLVEELHVFHDALARGELSALDTRHGLDALLLHYVLDDLFRENGRKRLGRRAANDKSRLT